MQNETKTWGDLGMHDVDDHAAGEQRGLVCPKCQTVESTTFADFGITGVGSGGGDQKVTCPECYSTHTKKHGQRDLSVNTTTGLFMCHRPECVFRGRVGERGTLSVNAGEGLYKCHADGCDVQGKLGAAAPWRTTAAPTPRTGASRTGAPRKTAAPRRAASPIDGAREDEAQPVARPVELPWDAQTPIRDEALYAAFAARGIGRAVVDRNRIFAVMTKRFLRGKEGGPERATVFPYFANGQLVNLKYRVERDGGKDFGQVKDCDPAPYGFDDVDDSTGPDATCAIVEGEYDKLAFEEAGYTAVYSLPNGAIQPGDREVTGKLKCLAYVRDRIAGKGIVYIATDADDPGQRTARELATRIGVDRCMIVGYPVGCKDANDVLRTHGAGALLQCLVDARPVPYEGVITVRDVRADVERLYRDGGRIGHPAGFPGVDELLQWPEHGIAVVVGTPSHGKGVVVNQLVTCFMANRDLPVSMFTPENYPAEDHTGEILQVLTGKPFGNRYRGSDRAWHPVSSQVRMSFMDVQKGLDFLSDRLFRVYPAKPSFLLDDLLESFAWQVNSYGIKVIAIDPWSMIDSSRPKGMTETEYIKQSLAQMRLFGRLHNVLFLIVVHPAKLDVGTRVETMYQAAGSAGWFDLADIGIIIRRNFPTDDTKVLAAITDEFTRNIRRTESTNEILAAKVRKDHMGVVGAVEMRFTPISRRLYPLHGAPDLGSMVPGARADDQGRMFAGETAQAPADNSYGSAATDPF